MVGAGLAGLRTAEALRERGFDGDLVLVGEEPHLPYDRPPLSKHVLRGEREPMYLRPQADYAALDLDLRLGTHVTALDAAAAQVQTVDGPIPYDVVVIATGAAPRRLPAATGLLGVHALRGLDDCFALRAELVAGARLGIVGAGLIGCEVAASARSLGLEVAVVDVLSGPMVRVLGEDVAERITQLHAEHGVHLHMGTGVAEVQQQAGRVTGLVTSGGIEIPVDVLLEAMGAVPATDWLADSGLTIADGVLCDEVGQAAPGVFAVGDVARWHDLRFGEHRRVEHWTRAVEQSAVVAAAILGERAPLNVPPYWWSDQYNLKLQGLGWVEPGDDVALIEVGPKSRTLALYSRESRLTGVVGFSAAAAVMRLRPDIVAGTPVAEVLAGLGS